MLQNIQTAGAQNVVKSESIQVAPDSLTETKNKISQGLRDLLPLVDIAGEQLDQIFAIQSLRNSMDPHSKLTQEILSKLNTESGDLQKVIDEQNQLLQALKQIPGNGNNGNTDYKSKIEQFQNGCKKLSEKIINGEFKKSKRDSIKLLESHLKLQKLKNIPHQ